GRGAADRRAGGSAQSHNRQPCPGRGPGYRPARRSFRGECAMSADFDAGDAMPVVPDPRQFDHATGNVLERAVFNYRALFLALCALLTLVLAAFAVSKLALRPGFEK